MSKKMLVAAAMLLTSTAAFADAPGKGDFGLGLSMSGAPLSNAATITSGLQLSYFALDQLELVGQFGLGTVNNGPTLVTFLAGANYFLVKRPAESYGLFLGGDLGIVSISQGGASNTSFILQAGGGAEYFFSKHFAAMIFEGIQFSTDPTTFAFVSRLGLNWYF